MCNWGPFLERFGLSWGSNFLQVQINFCTPSEHYKMISFLPLSSSIRGLWRDPFQILTVVHQCGRTGRLIRWFKMLDEIGQNTCKSRVLGLRDAIRIWLAPGDFWVVGSKCKWQIHYPIRRQGKVERIRRCFSWSWVVGFLGFSQRGTCWKWNTIDGFMLPSSKHGK